MPETEGCNLLCYVEFAINSTITESIGYSPFELVYWEQVRLPVDVFVGNQCRVSNAANIRV